VLGALVATTGALSLDDVAEVTADRDAMYRGAEQHRVLEFGAQQTATAPNAG
jgi:hypothetical protein